MNAKEESRAFGFPLLLLLIENFHRYL